MTLFLPTETRLIIQLADRSALLEVDVSEAEDHIFEGDVSEFPIEDGSKRSDHITIMPIKLEFDLRFTDLAISKFNPLRSIEESADGRGRKAVQTLIEWHRTKKELIIISGFAAYNNMVIASLRVPRSFADGRSVVARIRFMELPVVARSGAAVQGSTKTVVVDVEHTVRGLVVLGDLS